MALLPEHHIIYRTTCLVTGKWYVGMHSTTNLDDGYLGSGVQLTRSVKKHGRDQHTREILESYPSRALLHAREKELITEDFISDPLSMNLKRGGQGLTSGEAIKNWENPEYRAKQQAATAAKWTDEERARWSGVMQKAWEKRSRQENTDRLVLKWQDPAYREHMSAKLKEAATRQPMRRWVHKGDEVRRVKLSDLNTFLDNGYKQGRTK